jgi:cytochrome b involved in lipid metabolism
VSLVVMGLSVVVGHTGAEAVWKSRSLDSEAKEDTPKATPTATGAASPAPSGSTSAAGGLSVADVAKHNTAADCWSIVNGNVYDLTQWIPQHPGGPGVIEGMCGIDGTAAFEGQHQGSNSAASALAQFELGALGAAVPAASTAGSAPATTAASAAPAPTKPAAYTAADVASHNSPQDCWSIVGKNVYDLTQWIPQHPGGPGVIEGMCGIDGTAAFEGQHQGSNSAASALAQFKLGPLG